MVKPQVGISSCLLGQPVRYNGGHKKDPYLSRDLSTIFDWIPFCPEMSMGLGVPRDPIHLRLIDGFINLVDAKRGGPNLGKQLSKIAVRFSQNEVSLSGYVFKKNSPSCGLSKIPVFDLKGEHVVCEAQGAFSSAISALQPMLPLTEETLLHDPDHRAHFIIRVLAYDRLSKILLIGIDDKELLAFHNRHKYLLLAHDVELFSELDDLVHQSFQKADFDHLVHEYSRLFMKALDSSATPDKHMDVLQVIMGMLIKHRRKQQVAKLEKVVDRFYIGKATLEAPLKLIRHYLKLYPNNYLEEQHYLDLTPYRSFANSSQKDK